MDSADAELVQFFQGAMEWLMLLLVLAVVLLLWGWAADRGLRPADRGGHAMWPLLLLSFGTVAVLRVMQAELLVALVIAVGLLLAGLLSRMSAGLRLGLPAMLLATLLGLGHVLSAGVLAMAGFLTLLISRSAR